MWPTRGLGTPFLWATGGLGRKVTSDLTAVDVTISGDSATLGRIRGRQLSGPPITQGVIKKLSAVDITVTDDESFLIAIRPLWVIDVTTSRETAFQAAIRALWSVDRSTSGQVGYLGINDDINTIRMLDPDLFEVMFPEEWLKVLTDPADVCV